MINSTVVEFIKKSDNIVILSHTSPDGDSIGSSLAFYNALLQLNKNVITVIDDDIPKVFSFLKGIDEIEKPDIEHNFEMAIVLDCGDADRLGEASKYLDNSKIINIDHHANNTNFGLYNMVDVGAAATGEIVYSLIKDLGIILDKSISECLYTAILTDTGQFNYSNTSSQSHYITGDLIANGVEPSKINNIIYHNNSKEKVKLMGEAIRNLQFFYDNKISCITITDKDFHRTHAEYEDFEGIINIARDINSVEVALLIRENKDGKVKISLRSKDYIDVNQIAQGFGGGGHKKAAGITLQGNIYEIRTELIEQTIKLFMESKE